MESPVFEKQLFQSCKIIFGADLSISREFFEYLQLSGLKAAYRKRAMETHPDRVTRGGQMPLQRNTPPFHKVHEAYEHLLLFLKTKDTKSEPPGSLRAGAGTTFSNPRETTTVSPSKPRTDTRSSSDNNGQRINSSRQDITPIILPHDVDRRTVYANTESLYHGLLPNRQLLFGHYLYYSGLSNWRTIARILTWQRLERPRLGQLGQQYGLFCPDDITRILKNKAPFQPFGQAARAMGMLTELQLNALIAQQLRLQKKFGAILLEKNLITRHNLQDLLHEFENHNANIYAEER